MTLSESWCWAVASASTRVAAFCLVVVLASSGVLHGQSFAVQEIISFDSLGTTRLRPVPLYGDAIVRLDTKRGALLVYALDGELLYAIPYAQEVALRSPTSLSYAFVGAQDLRAPDQAEVVFALIDEEGAARFRRFSESGTLLYEAIIPAEDGPLLVDGQGINERESARLHTVEFRNSNEVAVYAFAGDAEVRRLPGTPSGAAELFPEYALVVQPTPRSVVAYDEQLEVATRMRPRFGAFSLKVLNVDFGEDGVLDAYSLVDTVIAGAEATRAIWYDETGRVYLDTFVLGRAGGQSQRYQLGLLPEEGGYYTAGFALSSSVGRLDITFRSDDGSLIADDASRPAFVSEVCYGGQPYLIGVTISFLPTLIDTLYDPRTGLAQLPIPERIDFEGADAYLVDVIGRCEADVGPSVELVYEPVDASRLLFADATGEVLAALPFLDAARAYRLAGDVYAVSDIDAAGTRAGTIYRVAAGASDVDEAAALTGLTLSPNPAADRFTLRHARTATTLEVRIADVAGREVLAPRAITAGQMLPAPSASGLYFVRVVDVGMGSIVTRPLVVR